MRSAIGVIISMCLATIPFALVHSLADDACRPLQPFGLFLSYLITRTETFAEQLLNLEPISILIAIVAIIAIISLWEITCLTIHIPKHAYQKQPSAGRR